MSTRRLGSTALAGALAGLALAACGKSPGAAPAPTNPPVAASAPVPAAALPLTNASAPASRPAPSASGLPPAAPAPVTRLRDPRQGYAYLDQAAAMARTFSDAPPDYTYDDNGVRPWVWRGDDGSLQVVEPTEDGDRYYYYTAGASLPFLIRDAGYSFGFDNGRLAIIYDRSGRPLPPSAVDQRVDLAGRYLARARAISAGARRQTHEAVVRAQWLARRAVVARDLKQWRDQRDRVADWRAYHEQAAPAERARWARERSRREADAARFAHDVNGGQGAALDGQAAPAVRDRARDAAVPAPRRPDHAGRAAQAPLPPGAPAEATARSTDQRARTDRAAEALRRQRIAAEAAAARARQQTQAADDAKRQTARAQAEQHLAAASQARSPQPSPEADAAKARQATARPQPPRP